MKNKRNSIEQALAGAPAAAGAAPAAEPSNAGMEPGNTGLEPGMDEAFARLSNDLYELATSGEAPAGFDLEEACRDEAFVALADEFGVFAAARIWAAEKRAAEAEKNAMARLDQRVQQRKGLPRSYHGGGYAVSKPDYAGMDSATFRKLSEEFRRRARNGERVQL